MSEADIALLITSLTVLLVFAGLFIWGLRSGQFRDIEEAKYRMLELGEPVYENVGKEGDKDA